MKNCVICKKPLAESKQDNHICHRKPCKAAYGDWSILNYDQLNPSSPWRKHCEDKFWEVTPEQRKYYARFFELMRPQRTRVKRKCLKCQIPITRLSEFEDHHLCAQCNITNSNYSELRAFA